MVLFYPIFIFIVGCVFGSFYYVVGTRLPNGESLVSPRSHCTLCKHTLGIFDLIPLFSFLFLKGKCRYCHQKLSKEYFIYEIFTGILFLISFLKYQFSYQFWILLILSSLVVLIFITDFKYMIILDSPLILFSLLIFCLQLGFFDLKYALLQILYGLGSFLTMLFIGKIGEILFKREAMGGGDIKFSFLIGQVLGYKYALMALIFSTFLALPYAVGSMLLKKDNEVPFGPFLVSSVFIITFFFEKFQYILYFF